MLKQGKHAGHAAGQEHLDTFWAAADQLMYIKLGGAVDPPWKIYKPFSTAAGLQGELPWNDFLQVMPLTSLFTTYRRIP